ncbi:MAG TPA: ATP-binding protein [Steroidobacteraceae bacterium]|nr:ATP-binding protein [Steroidobacteraceae bacterium]
MAALLPIAILSCVLLVSAAREQRERLYLAADGTVLALMNAVDGELKSTMGVIDALAASPRLARGDIERFREEALQLLARRPSWLNIVLSDRDHQLMNARVPVAEPLPPLASPASLDEVFRAGRPRIGRVMFAPAVDTYAFAVQTPYRQDGRVKYVLTAVVRPESLLELLELRAIAKQGVISILDSEHNVVARSLNHESWVGKSASAQLRSLLEPGTERGRGITKTLEGVPVYTVYRRSRYSGWSVAMGAPTSTVDAPMRNAYLLFGGAVAFSIVLGLAAALLVGRTIVRPMRELEQQALLLGSGQVPGMPQTRLPEVRRIAVALGAAHDARETAFRREHEARVSAEQASRAKDEFLAMLGHELRNPLAAITNASQLIEKKRATLDPEANSAVGIIGRQTKHLARLTDDLLDAGRVILGKISLSRAPLDLASVVRSSLEGLRGAGSLDRHRVDVELGSAWVHGDATRLDQIVSNLVTNAIKYTPPGGSVRIRTHLEAPWAVLTVADTGIGLEPELLPRVFDLFVQGERALDRSQGGLGIGLTLVRRLAELHGGTADATSAGTGRGAVFTVRLPASAAPPLALESPGPEVSQRRLHIALIEDNEDARMSLRMLLELEGHRVSEAADGIAGVELIASTPGIDIAFVDIGLPGMSGYAAAQGIRAARGKSIRLVAMSGYGADQDVERGERAGFDAYIVKPAALERVQQELALLSGNR